MNGVRVEVGEPVGVEPLREVGRPDEVLGAAEDVGVDDVNAAVLHRGDARPPRPLDERRPDCTQCLRIVPRVSADGQTLHWNDEAIDWTALEARLAELTPQTTLELQADRATPYEALARLMAAASRHGLAKIAFVTLPGEPAP